MSQIPHNWELLKTIVADALDLPAEKREAFLTGTCDGNADVIAEARALVESYEQADGVIDRRTDAWLGLGGPDLLSLGGQRIGRYTLDRLIAEGAMAAGYVATQSNPQRTVALKLVRFNLPLIDSAKRFQREAQALGRLQHPNIARIYEAGVHRPQAHHLDALPFIAMEYVHGPPLTTYVHERKLSREQRIRLIIKVASAVHAAHQQAIIHRDLKPANVLVDASSGEPKVLDFGIALVAGIDADTAAATWQTTAGVLLGTPGYMSPEQAAGRLDDVDVRSDVWSLGVLLYELLTQRLPIEVKNTSIAEVLRRLETTEPQSIGKLDRALRGDLETVVMTALAREKDRRYASAQAFADDLGRVLSYEPISARAPTATYRARKFARRHRFGIGIFAAFVVLLLVASIISSLSFIRARRERDKARAVNQFLQEMISSADPSIGSKDLTVLQALDRADARISRSFGADPLTEAEVRSTLGWTYFNLGSYDRANAQLTKAVDLRLAAGQQSDPITIDDQSRLATILRWQYKPAEALKVAQQAYDVAVAKLGPEHPSTLALLDPIAGSIYDMGDLPKAEDQYVKAVAINKKVMGETNEQTLTAMNNLAVVYIDRGNYPKAEAILRDLVSLRLKILQPSDPALLTSRLNLALAVSEQGRFDEAEKDLAQVAKDCERGLGLDHDSTISALSNWAEILERMGRTDEALAILKTAMDRSVAKNGVEDDRSIKEMSNYAGSLNQVERWPEAQVYAQKALDAALKLHGLDHPSVGATKGNLGAALSGQGRHAEAQVLERDAIAIYTKQFGPDHPRTLVQQSNLAFELIADHRSADALAILEPTLEKVLQKKVTYLEPAVRLNIGRALMQEQRYAEAESQLVQAYQLSDSRHEVSRKDKCAQTLATLYDSWSRPDDARRWRSTTMPTSP